MIEPTADGDTVSAADTAAHGGPDVVLGEDVSSEPADAQVPGPSPWRVPPTECEALSELGGDPLTLAYRAIPVLEPKPNGASGQLHLVDMMVGPEDGLLYAAGLPSLVIMDPSVGKPVTLGTVKGKAEHVAWAGSGRVALATRGYSSKSNSDSGPDQGGAATSKEPGVYIVDVSDPTAPTKLGFFGLEGAAGMAYIEGYLQVLTHAGRLHTLTFSGEELLEEVHQVDGLGNPWTLTVDGTWGYVADNSKGLVVVDFTDPAAPVIATTVMAQGGAQDVTLDGDVVFLAVGSKGIQAFDVSDPGVPVSLGVTEVDGAAINVSAQDGQVWYVTQQSVGVLDASDPAAPLNVAVEDTPSWAMAVAAVGTTGYVADWRYVDVFELDMAQAAPDADLERDELVFVGTTSSMTVALDNRGGAPLDIVGLSVDDARVDVEVDRLTIAPGEHIDIRLGFADDGEPLVATLCLATNDPDEPVQSVPVTTASSDPNAMVGQLAPDFTLPDLNGETHQLSQQLGHPVVLSYFATW